MTNVYFIDCDKNNEYGDEGDMENENKLDKWDILISVSSGSLTAAIDAIWISDISLNVAHDIGKDKVDNFVKTIAKNKGYKGSEDNLAGAIKFLEDEYPMDGDLLTNQFGGGSQHHLRDFSHHPTPVGLMFSMLMQITGSGYGTDTSGNFVSYKITNWERKNIVDAIYAGTVQWLFHLVSDIAGSSGTVRKNSEGTGIPGPILSFLKEISSMPGIKNLLGKSGAENNPNKEDNYNFSALCSKMFNGTLLGKHDINGKPIKDKQLKFDLRTELGIVYESINNKQYLPVVLNEVIVSAFYSVRRFMNELETNNVKQLSDIMAIDISRCLPWNNDSFRHMRMISTATFSVIDLSVAGIKASVKNKNNPEGFAIDFLQDINYWGIGNIVLSANSEMVLGVKKLCVTFSSFVEAQKQKILEKNPDFEQGAEVAKYTASTVGAVVKMGTLVGFISAAIGVYAEIKKALEDLEISKEQRIKIEKECEARINIIHENKEYMQEVVSEYLYNKMTTFTDAFRKMDKAITENDFESYILGNNMIQNELAGRTMFNTMEQFDDLMMSDDDITF